MLRAAKGTRRYQRRSQQGGLAPGSIVGHASPSTSVEARIGQVALWARPCPKFKSGMLQIVRAQDGSGLSLLA